MNFEDVCYLDATANRIMQAGGTAEDCVVALYERIQIMTTRLMELDSIAPRAYKTADGTLLVWRCPDALVPIRGDLRNSLTQEKG